MRLLRWVGYVVLGGLASFVGTAGQAVELVGRAVLPADTFAPGVTSGQLLTGSPNGRSLPFVNRQPVQGISAVIAAPHGRGFWVLQDNGFGGKGNSPDALLRIYGVVPDFAAGTVQAAAIADGSPRPEFDADCWIQLQDPAGRSGFALVAEQATYPGTSIPVDAVLKANRWLTGGDFDPESLRRAADGTLWLGDEFGPYLLNISPSGELLRSPIPIPNLLNLGDRPLVQSPDHPAFVGLPNDEARVAAANLPRSRGFEGMAINPSGTRLYPMLEGAIAADSRRDRLLIFTYDLTQNQFLPDQVYAYRLEDPTHAVGDLTALSDREFLIIERDNREGDARNPAFSNPARFKRIYKISLDAVDADGFLQKQLLVDLLNIPDPRGIGGSATQNGVFSFPFITIESVLPLEDSTLLVINDNNYPSSSGRTPGQPDNTEMILIRL